jgi:hypothetical protein
MSIRNLIASRRLTENEIEIFNILSKYELDDDDHMECVFESRIPEGVNEEDRASLSDLFLEVTEIDNFLECILLGMVETIPFDFGDTPWAQYKRMLDWSNFARILGDAGAGAGDILYSHEVESEDEESIVSMTAVVARVMPKVLYIPHKGSFKDAKECPVCYCKVTKVLYTELNCGHLLCIKCAQKIIHDSSCAVSSCPCCRGQIKEVKVYTKANEARLKESSSESPK